MLALISSCSLDSSGSYVATSGVLNPIPKKCQRCGGFRNGICAESPGLGCCRKGFAVWCSEDKKKFFFGARVQGICDESRITPMTNPISLTEGQFLELVSYDVGQIDDSRLEDLISAFSATFDETIERIKTLLAGRESGAIVRLPLQDVLDLKNAVVSLGELKSKTDHVLLKLVPIRLFPETSRLGRVERSVFQPEEICCSCTSRHCSRMQTTEVFSCGTCLCGCTVFSFQHKMYFGMRVNHWYRKVLCRTSVPRHWISTFLQSQVQDLLEFLSVRNNRIYTLRRFLHDVGQYIFGLSNLLPILPASSHEISICSSEAKSMMAFVLALKSLKQEFLSDWNPTSPTDRIVFAPYPLFHKYRACFECQDVEISIQDKDPRSARGLHEEILGPMGFEFVVLNLFSNAIKYMPKLPVLRKIGVVLSRDEIGMNIDVSSMGPSVSDEELKYLGQRGFRTESARKRNVSGQGLGLYRLLSYSNDAGYEARFFSEGIPHKENDTEYRTFRVRITVPAMLCRGIG